VRKDARVLRGLAAALLIFAFFCIMSRIDSIVHRTLYGCGLRFSYEWASGYWPCYDVCFILFSIIITVMY
jgi:hypothetical protein